MWSSLNGYGSSSNWDDSKNKDKYREGLEVYVQSWDIYPLSLFIFP